MSHQDSHAEHAERVRVDPGATGDYITDRSVSN
jgi:hypothetical protein